MQQNWLIELAAEVAVMGAAVMIVLAAVRLGSVQYRLIAPRDAEGVPLVHSLGFVSGLGAAVAMLLAAPHAADFLPHRLFARESSWDLTLIEFLRHHALPAPGTLLGALGGLVGTGGGSLVGAAWLAALATLAGLLVCFRKWRGLGRIRAMAGFALLALWSALILHYAVHLAAWGLTQLSFWGFLLALVAFQRWRQRSPFRAAHG
jgi:hypothetical protein